ncbi:carboxylate--amine ligase [Catenulispora sp. GAS73]|uniref:carboxylate--amine ligase n=1 Tax=Catenulispora sp. GAS73 TaxID=3156269 RepID=UPI003514D4BE
MTEATLDADTATEAVLLRLDRNVFHHGGLGVIRSLGRLGIPVWTMREDRFAPAALSRYARRPVSPMPAGTHPDDVLDLLDRLADRLPGPAVLITTDDAGAIFLAEYGDKLRPRYLFPKPPPDLPRRAAGKATLAEICRTAGAPHPATAVPVDAAEATAFADSCGYPVMAKVNRFWAADKSTNVRSTSIVHSRAELLALGEQVRRATGDGPDTGLLLQEYLAPTATGGRQDWFFHGYFDADSRCLFGHTGTKVRSYPAYAGLTSYGRWTPNQRLREESIALLTGLGYRGIVSLDYCWDPRDDSYRLVDFNPRLGAQFRLFHDSAGIDLVRAMHLDLTGRALPPGEAVPGRTLAVENYDPIAMLTYRRNESLSLRSWLSSMRAADEYAWFARDDLAPFAMTGARTLWSAAAHRLRREYGGREREPRLDSHQHCESHGGN